MSPKTSSHRRTPVLQCSNKKREAPFHMLGKARGLPALPHLWHWPFSGCPLPLSPLLPCFLWPHVSLYVDFSPLLDSPEAPLPSRSHTENSYWGCGTVWLAMENHVFITTVDKISSAILHTGNDSLTFSLSLNLYSIFRGQSSIPQIPFFKNFPWRSMLPTLICPIFQYINLLKISLNQGPSYLRCLSTKMHRFWNDYLLFHIIWFLLDMSLLNGSERIDWACCCVPFRHLLMKWIQYVFCCRDRKSPFC